MINYLKIKRMIPVLDEYEYIYKSLHNVERDRGLELIIYDNKNGSPGDYVPFQVYIRMINQEWE